MTNIINIREYSILHSVENPEKLEKLHELVGEFKGNLFIDGNYDSELLLEFLFNKGYSFREGKRPDSFYGIMNSVWHRKTTMINLDFLNGIIELFTKPHLAVNKSPLILTPENLEDVRIETSQGYDFEIVESMQIEWFSNPITESVLKYQKTLETAFDEYNNQAVLNSIDRSRLISPIAFLGTQDYEKIKKLSDRVGQVFDIPTYHNLDSAYYLMGNRYMKQASDLYKQLSESDFGKLFILSTEETAEGISAFCKDAVK